MSYNCRVIISEELSKLTYLFLGPRDPYAIDDDDLVMVEAEDAEGHSPKEGSKGSAPSKRKSKREVSSPNCVKV